MRQVRCGEYGGRHLAVQVVGLTCPRCQGDHAGSWASVASAMRGSPGPSTAAAHIIRPTASARPAVPGHDIGLVVQGRNCLASAKGSGREPSARRTGAGGPGHGVRPTVPGGNCLATAEGEPASDRAQKDHHRPRIAWQLGARGRSRTGRPGWRVAWQVRRGPGGNGATAEPEPAGPGTESDQPSRVASCLATAKGTGSATAPRRTTPEPELLGNWGARARTRPDRPGPELLGNREGEAASERVQKEHSRTGIAWQLHKRLGRVGTQFLPGPAGVLLEVRL